MASYPQKDNEDFRSRYAVETAGMPADLAAIANHNLAAEDAGIAKVNAVARLLPQQPDYSLTAPSDSAAPVSTGTSISDLHTDDIATRRAAIDDRKKQIQVRLGLLPPSAAGLAAVVLAGPKERKDLFQEWNLLDGEDTNLLREHQIVAVNATKSAHENLVTQSHIQAANGKAKIFSGLADIDEKYPKDSPEHRLAVLKLFGSSDPDIAAARGTPQFESLVRPFIDQHDKSVAIAARIKEAANQGADQYYSVEALHKDHPDAEYRQDPKTGGYYVALGGGSSGTKGRQDKLTSIVEGDLAKIGVRPDEFTARTNVRRGHLKNGEFSNKYSGAEKGDHVAFDVDGTTYTMPIEQFTRADKAHPIVAPPSSAATVKMIAPDGAEKNVPADQIEHYKKLGAKLAQ